MYALAANDIQFLRDDSPVSDVDNTSFNKPDITTEVDSEDNLGYPRSKP